MDKKVIHVIYATNDGYAPYAGVSISSLVENSSKNYFYEITVFHTDLSFANKQFFLSMQGENYSVKPLCVSRFIEKERKLMYTNFHFSKEMFYRILIPSVFADVDRAIYLDCDTVVLGDVSELYNMDLEGNIIAAANDIMHQRAKSYVTDELCMDVKKYINSGVLVIDCEKFRAENIKGKFFEELAVRHSLKYPDQDLINIVCHDRIKYLPRRWNYIWHYQTIKDDPVLNLSEEERAQYMEDAKDISLLHFTSAVKPWSNKTLELSKHFWKYVPGCPFEKQVIDGYNKVPMKRYVVYHFIDEEPDEIVVTASLYSLCETKYDDVVVTLDGEKTETEFYYKHIIEIAKRVYERSFFKIHVPKSSITDDINISFYDRTSGDPFIAVLSASFPVDTEINCFVQKGAFVAYYENRHIHLAPAEPEIMNKLRKRLQNNISNKNKDPNYRKSNVLRRIHRLLKPFMKKEIWFVSDRLDAAGDNGQAFFEYLCKTKPKGIKPYFVIEKTSRDYRKMKKIGRVIDPHSKKFKIYYLFCTRNISAHFEKGTLDPIYNKNQLKDILGKCKNVFLQHGIIKDDLSLVYNRPTYNFDMFVTSAKGEYDSIAYNPAYGCGEKVTKLTGLPRYDKLADHREKLVVILPTWRKYCYKSVVEKTPVDDPSGTTYVEFYNKLLHDPRLIDAAKQYGYKLCYYPHSLMTQFNKYIDALDKDVFVDSARLDYSDVFAKASLMFTDFSSTQFDFSYLRKPLIYCHFDKEEFFGSHTYREGYFDYERDGFGEVVYDLDSAVELLVGYMKNGCQIKEVYLNRIKDFFAYNDKNNCERVMQEILKL